MARKIFLVLFTLLLSAPVFADILVLNTGKALHIKTYSVEGDTIHVNITDRAEMAIPLNWVREIRATPDDPPPPPEPVLTSKSTGAFYEIILPLAKKHSLDWKLVTAVMATESNFNPRALSPKGALGLMQLMPGTARLYHVADPYDPLQNIEAGVQHLKMLLARYAGNLQFALAAYNSGEKAVDYYRGIPPFHETQDYVKRVLQIYRNL